MFAWRGFFGYAVPRMQKFEITFIINDELTQYKAIAYAHSAQQAADVFRAANKGLFSVVSVRLVKAHRDVPISRVKAMFRTEA